MNPLVKKAVERFDKAAREYAFRGTYSGSDRYAEVVDEYHKAKTDLDEQIGKAIKRAYNNGQNDGLSRAQQRPGYGDMGG